MIATISSRRRYHLTASSTKAAASTVAGRWLLCALLALSLRSYQSDYPLVVTASSDAGNFDLEESSEGNDEDDAKMRVVQLPGIVLQKPEFPGWIPARFVRRAYGPDALETKGTQTFVAEYAPGDACVSDVTAATVCDDNDANTDHNCDIGDFDLRFGTALLRKAREMFRSRNIEHELEAMLEAGTSNPLAGSRRMHWVGIEITPNKSLALHSHPNVEFAYIVRGAMHEWRLVANETIASRKRAYVPETVYGDPSGLKKKYVGPDLRELDAGAPGVFQHNVYRAGDMFINAIGDVHQSFSKEEGVVLFVLWGDGNADILEEGLPMNAQFLNEQSAKAWA